MGVLAIACPIRVGDEQRFTKIHIKETLINQLLSCFSPWHRGCHYRGMMKKQQIQAAFYYILIILAVHIAGCRNSTNTGVEPGLSTLEPPTSIEATVISTTELDVSWTNTDFPDLTKVILQYKKSSEATFTEVDVGTSSEHSLSSLEADTAYEIKMKSIGKNAEESEFSSIVTETTTVDGGGGGGNGTCPVATGLDANPLSPTQVQLAWTWSTANYSEMASYLVQRKLATSNAWTDVQNITVNGAPEIVFTDVAAIPGAIHYRIVSDCNQTTYNSSVSDTVTAYVALEIPTITSVVDYGVNHRVNFNYTTDGLSDHTGFQLQYTVGSNPAQLTAINTYTGLSQFYGPSFTTATCPVNTLVKYQIRATRGNLSLSSEWSAEYTVLCPW